MTKQLYSDFLGSWVLIAESCDYEQGEPPTSGRYDIDEIDGKLQFTIAWTDRTDKQHNIVFAGPPDGKKHPFDGGELADSLAIKPVSPRELTSAAYWRGDEIMVAQRQLDDTRTAMRVVQLVRFPNGSHQANTAIYRKLVRN